MALSFHSLNRVYSTGRLYLGGMELAHVQDINFDFAEETIQAFSGNSLSPWAVDTVSRNVTGSFTVGALSPEMLAHVHGTTAEASGIIVVEEQSLALATSVSLGHTQVVPDMCAVWVDGRTKKLYREVASAPVTGEFALNDETGVLTFAAADAGKTGYASYGYRSSTGTRGYIDEDISAEYMTLRVTPKAGNEPSKTSNDRISILLPRVKVHGWSWTMALNQYSFPSFNFTALPGDDGRIYEFYADNT